MGLEHALGVIGSASKIAPTAWRYATRFAGFADSPKLTIQLANPVDQAREPWLEWLHLEVRNVGLAHARSTQPAREAQAFLTVRETGKRYALMWSRPVGGAALRLDVFKNAPEGVPLVLRSRVQAGIHPPPHRGSVVEPNRTYIVDVNFLTQGLPESVLEPGEYTLEVSVQYGAAIMTTACFRLTVPHEDSLLGLHLAEIDC